MIKHEDLNGQESKRQQDYTASKKAMELQRNGTRNMHLS